MIIYSLVLLIIIIYIIMIKIVIYIIIRIIISRLKLIFRNFCTCRAWYNHVPLLSLSVEYGTTLPPSYQVTVPVEHGTTLPPVPVEHSTTLNLPCPCPGRAWYNPVPPPLSLSRLSMIQPCPLSRSSMVQL